jgi:phage terminase large subunit
MITADSARPETISYMKKAGYRMRGAKKGAGSVEDGVQFIRGFKEIVIHDRCRHTADEFKLYSYKRDKLTGEILPVLEDKHNHCIDALRYALEAVMRQYSTPSVTATRRVW